MLEILVGLILFVMLFVVFPRFTMSLVVLAFVLMVGGFGIIIIALVAHSA